MKLHIAQGRIVDPASGLDAVTDLFVADGKIAAIGSAPAGFKADRVIDAAGKLVLPGLVDLAARLRKPVEYRATLELEMRAALAGGVTSVILPPDTDPTLDEPGLVEMLRDRARQLDQVNLYPLGAMTVGLGGKVITEMAELTEAGCVGLSQADVPVEDTTVLLRAMQYARTFDYVLWLQPNDPWLSRDGVAASGAYAARLGLPGVPAQSESIALHTLFELHRATGARLHLCRLATAGGVELVRRAKREGLGVTCDVSINHLHLTDVDIGYYDSNFRLNPPLYGQRDRDAILAGLADGTIDAICSDHTPVSRDGKMLPFAEAQVGAAGLELLLPLTLLWAARTGTPLLQALARITSAPARILGASCPSVPACGSLAVGVPADLCIVDPQASWMVAARSPAGQNQQTPFIGIEMPASVIATLVRGRVLWEQAA
jgi:dihydroorotase